VDQFDRSILKLLQQDSGISTEAIGHHVGLSSSACQRRIKKLKASGIVEKTVTLLNRNKLNRFATIIVDVLLEKGGEKRLDEVVQKLHEDPRVQQIYYTAGEVDLVLVIVVEDMPSFDRFTRELLMSDSNIQKFHSKVVIQSPKIGLDIPL
jgi:DNA-binding Lrp family transcriptional regulator